MNSKRTSPIRSLSLLVVIVGLLQAVPASALIVVTVFPPPAFIASAAPVYYGGHPTYWWGGHWYWRDPYGWHMWQAEPPFLLDWRSHHDYGRHYYEPRGGGGPRGRWHR